MLNWNTECGEDCEMKTLRFSIVQEITHECSFVKSTSYELYALIKISGLTQSYL